MFGCVPSRPSWSCSWLTLGSWAVNLLLSFHNFWWMLFTAYLLFLYTANVLQANGLWSIFRCGVLWRWKCSWCCVRLVFWFLVLETLLVLLCRFLVIIEVLYLYLIKVKLYWSYFIHINVNTWINIYNQLSFGRHTALLAWCSREHNALLNKPLTTSSFHFELVPALQISRLKRCSWELLNT